MLKYETITIWDTIHKIMVEWIESIVKEGWNIWRAEDRLTEIAENLTKRIVKSLYQKTGVDENQILHLLDLFNPVIYTWIDNILLEKSDFYRYPEKLQRYSITITSDLVRLFLKEEDYIEYY